MSLKAPASSPAVFSLSTLCSRRVSICHQFGKPLPPEARPPFSLLNLTGQRMRYYQPFLHNRTESVTYLRHGERGVLSFGATMTLLRNLTPVEVPFSVTHDICKPGDETGATETGEAGEEGGEAGVDREGDGEGGLQRAWTVSVQVRYISARRGGGGGIWLSLAMKK